MRLYLDTNVLTYMVTGRKEEIDEDTLEMLSDYANVLYTSAACVHELIYLLQSGKVERAKDWKKDVSVLSRIDNFGVTIVPINSAHLRTEESLPLFKRHKDPIDRLIISQAITDKAMLVSSDTEFPLYREYGLELHQNIR